MASLGELQTPDERTLRFTPLGFATAHKLRPEAAADLQQSAVDVGLAEAVPEQVRGSFDRVRMLHAYGVLSYELFTAAHDLTRLILEQALRTRFVEYYDGTIPLVAKDRTPAPLVATNFDVVYDALNGGFHRKARRLVVGRGPEIMHFRGSLNDCSPGRTSTVCSPVSGTGCLNGFSLRCATTSLIQRRTISSCL